MSAEVHDPVVQLCDRWLRTKRMWREAYSSDYSLKVDSRDCLQFEQICDQLFAEILSTPTTSVEGIARLLDVLYANHFIASRPGTEDWEEELNSDSVKMLRHIRNGAGALAKLDGHAELGTHADH